MPDSLINHIVAQLRDLQSGNTWLDESLTKKLDPVSDEEAFRRPIPDVHSVAELVSHMLVWRREAIRKLQGGKPELAIDSPSNWRTNDELKRVGWRALRGQLYASTKELADLIHGRPDAFLENVDADGYAFKYLIEGLIHHDLYHLGQIGITVKLLKTGGGRTG